MCSGLALGSWLRFALAALYAALILRRVFFEDAFLQARPGRLCRLRAAGATADSRKLVASNGRW